MQNINLNIDPERRHYLLDASLKVCPLGEFNHFLIIHIEYMETVNIFNQNTCSKIISCFSADDPIRFCAYESENGSELQASV